MSRSPPPAPPSLPDNSIHEGGTLMNRQTLYIGAAVVVIIVLAFILFA
jgi:hypothetical protein